MYNPSTQHITAKENCRTSQTRTPSPHRDRSATEPLRLDPPAAGSAIQTDLRNGLTRLAMVWPGRVASAQESSQISFGARTVVAWHTAANALDSPLPSPARNRVAGVTAHVTHRHNGRGPRPREKPRPPPGPTAARRGTTAERARESTCR